MCLSYPSIELPICLLFTCLPVYLPVYLPLSLSVYMYIPTYFTYLPAYQPTNLPVYLPACLPTLPPTYPKAQPITNCNRSCFFSQFIFNRFQKLLNSILKMHPNLSRGKIPNSHKHKMGAKLLCNGKITHLQ